jgi:uncharacterized iron-regulated membrane protein
MRSGLDFIHRWLGAFVGLGLAILGLSGTLLLWKPFWVGVAQTPRSATEVEMLRIIEGAEALGATHVTLPSAEFGVAQAGIAGGGGAYLSHDGKLLARWTSVWDRPETLLFDLHHHLLMGHDGAIIGGWLGLAAILFVMTGAVLWWPTRRTFHWRALPKRLSRPAIIRHHRDLGALLALPILVSAATGSLMTLKPLSNAVLGSLSSPKAMEVWQSKPPTSIAGEADWPRMLASVCGEFPQAEARIVIWPKSQTDAFQVRVRQPSEWHPNGRTSIWLDGSGNVVAARDAAVAPLGARAQHALYPLHSARMSGSSTGLYLRIILTIAGLGLTLLGSLTVMSFWRERMPREKRRLAGV